MNRIRVGVALVFGAFLAFIASACASTQHDPYYDGGLIVPSVAGDSATYVRITVQNTRVHEPSDPTFYLVGAGQHSLGVIAGPGGKVVRFIDTRWFGADGCIKVVAHYVGWGDITLPRVCWTPGNVVDASLNEIVSTSTAWAHR